MKELENNLILTARLKLFNVTCGIRSSFLIIVIFKGNENIFLNEICDIDML